ncbi:MAG: FAD-binding protein [Clostridia bacterium]|nr:FAD-binding protein [Clostridia bacterium]
MELKPDYDVLIVGAGVAGMYGALRLPAETRVLMLSKYALDVSSSNLAQGGVAAVLSLDDDSYDLHFEDTLIAGRHENDPSAVDVLVHEGPDDVRQVMAYGADFDRAPDGSLDKTLEGGHSRRRIVHHRDCTGAELVRALSEEVRTRPNITLVENAAVLTLKKMPGGGFGALVSTEDGVFPVYAPFTVLATGGIGRVYRYTTNPRASTGDGVRLAWELGAWIKDLSWIQFHPTAFHSEDGEQFLISESVRGEGAYLLNCEHERFMHRYDDRLELAPRDVVSRSIMLEEQRTGSSDFFLDITHENADFLRQRFPAINEGCLKHGVDFTKDLIPVYPCQHYLMGGIEVDLDSRTTVPGLYAVGECSNTGVHGKNRLASNSLLEAMVFSRRAADSIAASIAAGRGHAPAHLCMKPDLSGKPIHADVCERVRGVMQRSHFVIPDPEKAKEGLEVITELLSELKNGGYALTLDYAEALSLATVAYIVLTEASRE